MSEHLLTVEQAALRLHLQPSTIRRQLRDGILNGIKSGHVWRVPESALYLSVQAEQTPVQKVAEDIWRDMTSGIDEKRGAALIALSHAPEAVAKIVVERSGEAAARFYASPAGQREWDEMADWRALDGEPFHGFEDEEVEDNAQ